MRTSFHHQPEAQHLILQLSTSWQADYPIFRGAQRTNCGAIPRRMPAAALTDSDRWELAGFDCGERFLVVPSCRLGSRHCRTRKRKPLVWPLHYAARLQVAGYAVSTQRDSPA
jgi:hypothetical protein